MSAVAVILVVAKEALVTRRLGRLANSLGTTAVDHSIPLNDFKACVCGNSQELVLIKK